MGGWLILTQKGLSPLKKRQASLDARRGREGSCPPSPRTDPGVRFSRTGLFRQLRFRKRFTASSWLFPTVRFALVIQPYVSGQGFLYGLQLSVSPFPM